LHSGIASLLAPVRPTQTRSEVTTRKKGADRARLAPDKAIELVEETSAQVLGRRIETLGVHGSGAYAHYQAMLEKNRLVTATDLTVVEMVVRLSQGTSFDSCHEIGSGLGILSFLLALEGYDTVGIESDRRRHQTAQAIWEELRNLTGADGAACRLECRRFPALPRDLDPSHAVAILTDFVTTQTPQRERAIFSGLQRYPLVIVDLRRFCIIRATATEQRTLLERFVDNGFEQVGESTPTAEAAFVALENVRPRGALLRRFLAGRFSARFEK
jgi:hypothetical protein